MDISANSQEAPKNKHDDDSTPRSTTGGPTTPGRRVLAPSRSCIRVSRDRAEEIGVEHISHTTIGWKAFGLTCLPEEWVPPFLVIGAETFDGHFDPAKLENSVRGGLAAIGVGDTESLFVRSSGENETIRDRGRLPSKCTTLDKIGETITSLLAELPDDAKGTVHWIVQRNCEAKAKGQLSNERRLKYEKRDWVVEFEPRNARPGYWHTIAIRQWRDGKVAKESILACNTEAEITLQLRNAAKWGCQFSPRLLYEWVWDGTQVFIVQADLAGTPTGENPYSFIPGSLPPIGTPQLRLFRAASSADYKKYGKLANASTYAELGYTMPPFYVMDDPSTIGDIVAGNMPSDLLSDLAELTRRPLIIRTDGEKVPKDKREMLPRSEALNSEAKAKTWLLGHFRAEIVQNDLGLCELCLIAHYFIPAVASAWARAEPGNRVVRIEALWGIPEGLYWYSHDTFEVDTQSVEPPTADFAEIPFSIRTKPRFKGRFVAPDGNGNWTPHETREPLDWKETISKTSWIKEIANTTRRIAEKEERPVAVMWFVETLKASSPHSVLPWYHCESAEIGSPRAAPRRKYASAVEFQIHREKDWENLKKSLEKGARIERVIVEPMEPGMIRNPGFLQEFAALAAEKGFVVELSGGILSHAYHILHSNGAQVECVDLFGGDEYIVEYNKVVRDKVPARIKSRGERVEVIKLQGDALLAALRRKLVEEAYEALDSKTGDEIIGELADVQEVIDSICEVLNVAPAKIAAVQSDKFKKRGGFGQGIMLTKTATPQSIARTKEIANDHTLNLVLEAEDSIVISSETEIPSKPFYRRPDLRNVEQEPEKLFSFETELNRIEEHGGTVDQTLNFSMDFTDGATHDLSLTVELRRIKSVLRGVVRMRLLPDPQLSLDLDA